MDTLKISNTQIVNNCCNALNAMKYHNPNVTANILHFRLNWKIV